MFILHEFLGPPNDQKKGISYINIEVLERLEHPSSFILTAP